MRNFPPTPSLRRRVESLSPKVEIVIACEGEVTEPAYFRECIDYYGAGMVTLKVLPKTGVPITVVRHAIAEKERLTALARPSKGLGLSVPFSVWAVFDKDEHVVDEALSLAGQHKIGIAFSNPCFELWPLLHLVPSYGSQDGRHAVQRQLQVVMPGYDHESNPRIDFALIRDLFPQAYDVAQRLNKARVEEACANGCPSTTVGVLVRKVMDNGRINFRREPVAR